MKILAVRGTNLASLPTFEVRFDRAPLAQAGLFAIVGRTGAGKSTILDAICLALYGQTPRLSEAPKTPIVRDDLDDTVRVDDPRTLLRRGAIEATAEVEFLDRFGAPCVARWYVRRSRNRPNGAVQKVEMTLTDVGTGVVVGDNISTARAEILRRVGLTFAQFRRTVLLSQGDFAAFLRAESGERAQLLEHVTGKAVYGQIGKRVHELTRDARGALELVRAEGRGQVCLSAEDRETAEQAARAAAAELTAARSRLEGARNDVAWHDRRDALAGAAHAGRQEEATALSAVEAGSQTRAWLARVDATTALRPVVAQASEHLARAARAGEAASARKTERERAAKALGEAAERLEAAREGARSATAELTRITPEILRARALDVALREAARAATQAVTDHDLAAKREAQDNQSLLAAQRALTEATNAADAHRSWLESKATMRTLVAEWPRWQREMERFAGARTEARSAREALPNRRAARDGAQRAWTAADEAAELAAARLAAAGQACAAIEADAPPPDALAQARSRVDEQRAIVSMLEAVSAEARRLAAEVEAAEARGAEAAAEAEAADTARRDATERVGQLEPALAEAKRGLDTLLARRDLSAHRAELRAGEPCPVCGALEHPFATGLPALDAAVEDARARVGELSAQLTGAQRRSAAAEADATGHRRARDEARAVVAAHANALAASETTEAGARLPREREVLAAAEGDLQAAEGRAAQHAVAVKEHRAALDVAIAEERASTEARGLADRARTVASRAFEETTALAADAHARMEAALAELRPALALLAGWEARLHEEPQAIVEAGRVAARDWTVHQNGLERCLAEAGSARERVAAFEAGVRALREATTGRKAEMERADGGVARLRDDRSGLLGGADADALEKKLLAAVEGNAGQSRQAEATHGNAVAAGAAAEAALSAAAEAARTAAVDAEAAADTRDTAVRGAGFTLGEVQELLAQDEVAVRDARAGVVRAAEELARAKTVAKEREAQLAAHAATRGNIADRAGAEAAMGDAGAEVAAIEPRAQAAQFRIQADDSARTATAAILPRLHAAQAQVDRWAPLDDLLGSADGRVFREFAQGLTLQALLAHANVHLSRLAPRYRLARVKGHDLEMQVIDAWSADEVRGIPSLSGGETFLVSLALALGLASLSSGEVATGSLFIDEGFGTLDSESMNLALDVLEQLQASGRQVGIISHVGGLADRIEVQVRVTPVNGGASRVATVRG